MIVGRTRTARLPRRRPRLAGLKDDLDDRVENALARAVGAGMLTVVKENGRSCIRSRGGIPGKVPLEVQGTIGMNVRHYGLSDDHDLAIMTTALFLQDAGCSGPDKLAKAVIASNPRFDVRRVCSLLDRSDVVYRSW